MLMAFHFLTALKHGWAVLCAVQLPPVIVFSVALTCGTSERTNLDFLQDTVRDIGIMLQNGMGYSTMEGPDDQILEC